MNILFFILILLFSGANAHNNCENIVDSIGKCQRYSCTQFFDDSNFIEYQILGTDDENLCIYTEKQDNNKMVCHYSKYGIKLEQEYLRSILKSGIKEINDFVRLTNLRAEECFFVNNKNLTDKSQKNLIETTYESNLGKSYLFNDVNSIFFEEELVNKIIHKMEQPSRNHQQ